MTSAVGFLRRRTVARSLRAYVRWVGRAIGWWTVGYLIFWLVVFGLSAFEALPRAATPLPQSVAAYASLVVAAWLLSVLLTGRVPPVHLDSRDLYRLALAPVSPHRTLSYRLWLQRGSRALGGAALGAIWALFSSSFLHQPAPWAPLALALLGLARFDLAWLRYAARTGSHGATARSAALWLPLAWALSAAAPPASYLLGAGAGAVHGSPMTMALSVTAALTGGSPLVVIAPMLLTAVTLIAVRRSLTEMWPRRFAAQSLVLGQLQGLRVMRFFAAMAGLGLGSGAEPGERDRLLATLYDRPGSTRPRRSLARPEPSAPAWQAFAWRTASALYRRPVRTWFFLAAKALAASLAGLLAASQVVGGATAVGAAGGTAQLGGSFGGALTVLLAGFMTARATAAFVGPGMPTKLVPVPASARNLGRVVPVLVVLAVLTPLAWLVLSAVPIGAADASIGLLVAYLTVLLTGVLAVEKYSAWSGVDPGRLEPQLVAALLVALPALVLQALGYPDWVLGSQVALLFVVSLIDV